ncbi:MAG: nucleoside triphosphate pyrophosphohydrolase [Christensenellales bacterium]
MSTTKYNKLVRDLVPDIIQSSGKTCVYSVLSDADYITMLDAKLTEELAEYQENKSLEELADLLEVIMAIAEARGSSIDEVDNIRQDKAAKRGSFSRKILLTLVTTND